MYYLAHAGLEQIHTAASKDSELTATTVYLLVRGTAYSAVVGGLLFALINLARSALDQATRFDKRLVAAHFIDYAVHADGVDAKKMEVALRILEAWGASVESAYTPSKVAAKRPEALKIAASKDGASFEHTSATHD